MYGPNDCANYREVNRQDKARAKKLMPRGIPRYVRVYDAQGVGDRYTAVFTKRAIETVGPLGSIARSFQYLGMSANPFHPQGIGQHGESVGCPIDRPTSKHLGRRITFKELPPECQKAVLQDYRALWGLP